MSISLTKQQFIDEIVKKELKGMSVLSVIDKSKESEKFFLLISQMSMTFDLFNLEKPDYINSWVIHEEIVDALETALASLKENHTDDGRG